MRSAEFWIERLGLESHPEGGYYRETYRSPLTIAAASSGGRFDGSRSVVTSIYFLLTSENFSAFHRLRSDENWHFHDGNSLTIHVLEPDGAYRSHRLGLDVDAGALPHAVIPAGRWFGSNIDEPGGFALVGCTVAPGFDFRDFELGRREELLQSYPGHQQIIHCLTR